MLTSIFDNFVDVELQLFTATEAVPACVTLPQWRQAHFVQRQVKLLFPRAKILGPTATAWEPLVQAPLAMFLVRQMSYLMTKDFWISGYPWEGEKTSTGAAQGILVEINKILFRHDHHSINLVVSRPSPIFTVCRAVLLPLSGRCLLPALVAIL